MRSVLVEVSKQQFAFWRSIWRSEFVRQLLVLNISIIALIVRSVPISSLLKHYTKSSKRSEIKTIPHQLKFWQLLSSLFHRNLSMIPVLHKIYILDGGYPWRSIFHSGSVIIINHFLKI